MSAYRRTVVQAQLEGWNGRFIDDDCMILESPPIETGHVEIQVSFDRFSPSWSFVSASWAPRGDWSNPTPLSSYAAVRKFMSEAVAV